MSQIAETIRNDLNQARRDRDQLKTLVLTTTLSELHNQRIQSGKDLNADEILTVLTRAVKKRNEAVEQYRAVGRNDLADKEAAEAEIIKAYLPQQMSEDEARELIRAVISGGANNMGAVMKLVSPQTKGRFDGKRLSEIVKEMLA